MSIHNKMKHNLKELIDTITERLYETTYFIVFIGGLTMAIGFTAYAIGMLFKLGLS
jgi:hypothetical protein